MQCAAPTTPVLLRSRDWQVARRFARSASEPALTVPRVRTSPSIPPAARKESELASASTYTSVLKKSKRIRLKASLLASGSSGVPDSST